MISIAHISDLHFTRVLPGSAEALRLALDEIEPDLIVASGDFTMAGRPVEFRAAEAFLNDLDAPIVACPGNHDIPAYNLFERFARPARRYDRSVGLRTRSRFADGRAAVLALNSARPWDLSWNWSHGRLSPQQIDEADAFFAEHADHGLKLLVTHHPFVVPTVAAGFRRIGNADRMLAVLRRHGVHAVLTGHLHRQFAGTLAAPSDQPGPGLQVFQAGTTLSDRHRDEPNGFTVLHSACRDGGIDAIEAYRFEDGAFRQSRFAPMPESAFPADLPGIPRVESAAVVRGRSHAAAPPASRSIGWAGAASTRPITLMPRRYMHHRKESP